MAQSRNPAEPEVVDPSVDTGPSEGVTTLAEMFGSPTVVDEVNTVPLPTQLNDPQWVVRPSVKVEDMTVGYPDTHVEMEPGRRYSVPFRVAQILYDRDQLMEIPYPFDETAQRR